MPPAVHQDQVDFGKLFHFLPHQCLHGDAAVSIVRNKSDVFRLRIKRLDHPDIIFYIVLIDKSRLQFRYIHVVGKEIYRFRHPCVQSGNRILRQTMLLLTRLHITGTFTCIESRCDRYAAHASCPNRIIWAGCFSPWYLERICVIIPLQSGASEKLLQFMFSMIISRFPPNLLYSSI